MALEISTYRKSQIANAEFGKVTPVLTDNFQLKLFSNTVSLAGVGTELTGGGYAALTIANNLTNFPATTNGVKTNAVALQMATLSADSLEVVSAGLFDLATGELLYRKVFAVPFVIANGSFFILSVGDLRFEQT